MKRFTMWKQGLVAALILILSACGGGGGGGGGGSTALDRDGDGIPNTEDSFPDDPTRFVAFGTVLLSNLTGGQFGTAVAVNDSGRAVGFSGNNVDEVKAVFWDVDPVAGTAGAPTILNPLGANLYSAAYGINDGGVVVGESASGADTVAVTWPAGATAASPLALGTFGAPAAAYGINPAGRAVGEATDNGNPLAVLWLGVDAAPVSLGLLPGGSYSSAYYISDNGLIVGEADDATGETRAVVWALSPLGAVSAPVDLGTPSAAFNASIAFGVDDSGRVVGESVTVDGETHATLWTLDPVTLAPTAVSDLGAAGSNSGAYAVGQGGRIVGYDGRSGSLIASILDTRNSGLVNAILTGGGTSTAFGMNAGNLAVGISGNQGFAAISQ